MKLLYRIISYLLIIPVLSLTSGCASYRFGRLPSPYINDHPLPVTQKGVSMAVEFLNYTQADSTFDCELTKKKVTPVYIVIDNKSDIAYGFRKTDVDSSYLSAEEVAKKCARSTMGRLLGYGFLALCPFVWLIFLPMLIGEMINCPTINSRMKNDYITNEIADTTIGPNRSICGVMFVAVILWLAKKYQHLNVFCSDNFWINFIILLALVALIEVGWELGEFFYDRFFFYILHIPLLHPNIQSQASSSDTMGDLFFSLVGAALAAPFIKEK